MIFRFLTLLLIAALLSGCNIPDFFSQLIKPPDNICEVNQNPSDFSDSMVRLEGVTVVRSFSIFSVCYAELTDGNCNISLLTTKVYRVNEIVSISARFKVLMNNNHKFVTTLITDDFPINPDKILEFL